VKGDAARRATLIARFWRKVDKNGPAVRSELGPCWLWTGKTDGGRYGSATIDGHRGAHRTAYAITHGSPGDAHVLHKCDVKLCVNPSHLELGDNAKNIADAAARGLTARGARNPASKLTEAQVLAIRGDHAAGVGVSALAAAFGVSAPLIHFIVTGKTWKHVGGPRTTKRRYACSICGGNGHNARVCTRRAA
jgi:hypothetical protein